ncbi:hypothetical protein [Variovorax boronicumulans]|uniref:hypothetical protein n=1 Tax=Variovorax boronicumulans TaxID=436515 RepID=UPI00214B3927
MEFDFLRLAVEADQQPEVVRETDGEAATGGAGTAVHPVEVPAITVNRTVAHRELCMLKTGPQSARA